MSGKYTDYWRIVKPAQNKTNYVGGGAENSALYSNFNWYSKVMKGASSRFSKYSQYKNMDSDVFVSRALDTIAEEMTQSNNRTNLPFEIDYQNENNKEVPASITMTIRAALRHWCDIQSIPHSLYDIARITIKFGDCFFQKTSDFKKWKYIDPSDIIGISLDEQNRPAHYHVRGGGSSGSNHTQGALGDISIIPKDGIVHFTLSSFMGDNGPFGDSPLASCVKAFRHLSMLEDSVIIYRIVRAPERRVFFIDTGNMPPQRVKAYLESVKNGMRQKQIPNESGGTDNVDSVYNPQCLVLDTKIPLLDGRTLELNQLINEHNQGKQNWAYSCNPITGEIVPGLISWAGITRKNAKVLKITLDSGKEITCTPDHKFPVLGKGFINAELLTVNDSLISYETKDKKIGTGSYYKQIFDHSINKWKFSHRIVAEFFKEQSRHNEFIFSIDEIKDTVHHKDFNSKNNNPENLIWMNKKDHMLYHRNIKADWWNTIKKDINKFNSIREKISNTLIEYNKNISVESKTIISNKLSKSIKSYHDKMRNSSDFEFYKSEISRKSKISTQRFHDSMSKEERKKHVDYCFGDKRGKFNNIEIKVSSDTVNHLAYLTKTKDLNKLGLMDFANKDEKFLSLFKNDNEESLKNPNSKICGRLTDHVLERIYKDFNYDNWRHFKEASINHNHRISKIEFLDLNQDTGCITIDQNHEHHDFHTFALEAGVFTRNSNNEDFFFSQSTEGKGSRVETLPGGENLGEIGDLTFFQNKFLQGLRIPSSYMRGGQEGGSTTADGKVGIAYIEEVRFSNYVSRLQQKLNGTFDDHFKAYLKSAGIKIDRHLFKIRLCDPQNFKNYKQAEVDEKMISNFSNIKDVPYLSARYKMMHYLGMSEDDIQENQFMLMQELNIPENGINKDVSDLRMMYDPNWIENKPKIQVDEKYDNYVKDETSKEIPDDTEEIKSDVKSEKDVIASSEKEPKEVVTDDKPKSLDDLKRDISK